MSRPLRIEYNGAWYHVMNRGLGRRDICKSEDHFKEFTKLLDDVSGRFGVEIHGYCMMSNHYHLLIKTPLGNLGRAMRHLNSIYTMRFNRSVRRDGSLFRGRYKAILIEDSEYKLNVSRYIHKNPSAAKIVTDDSKYGWSSYKYYLDAKQEPVWLKTSEILSNFGSNSEYASYVEAGVDKETQIFYDKKRLSPILGSELFKKKIIFKHFENRSVKEVSQRREVLAKKYKNLDEILMMVCADYGLSRDDVLNGRLEAKKVGIYLSMMTPNLLQKEIGEYYGGMSYSAVSKSFTRMKEYISANKKLRGRVVRLVERLVW